MAAAALLFTPGTAEAVMIDGGISLAGGYTPDNPDLGAATEITFGPAVVISSSGDFAMPAFSLVTMASSLVWDPLFTVNSNPLWSVGGFEFELNSLAIMNESSSSITLNGMGVVSHTSYDDTPGSWVATFNSDGNSTFSWSSSTAALPDGGASVALLGVAMVGIGMIRRKV